MSKPTICVLVIGVLGARGATAPPDNSTPLAKLSDRIAAAKNFTCHRRMIRYSQRGSATRQYDSVDLTVGVLGHAEAYSEIWKEDGKHGRRHYRSITDLPQAWFSGELVSMLEVIRQQINVNGNLRGEMAEVEGEPAVMYEVAVPASALAWNIYVHAHPYPVGFTLRVWFSADTGDLLRSAWLAREISSLPESADIQALSWTTQFRPLTIDGVSQSLPVRSLFQVFYSGQQWRVDWTENTYTDFRRYGSKSEIRFE